VPRPDVAAASERWRLFLALPVDETVKEALRRRQSQLKPSFPKDRISWTNPEGMHLTIKFLGETAVERIALFDEPLARAAAALHPIGLTCRGTGVFPTPVRPRVFWAGLTTESPDLTILFRRIEDICHSFGYQREKQRFSPHITLGRIRQMDLDHYAALDVSIDEPRFGQWTADRLILYRSELSPAGALYSSIKAWPLGIS
jgi:RNA 2',3'-cyclic 3'-phosphodiesterase